jgi:hypothetical protein
MKTTRVILKVPFYKHPAGTVFDLSEDTEPANWPDDERLREKQNFSGNQVYQLPDGGRGFAVSLAVSDTKICPEHVFEGHDIRKGPCRVTSASTQFGDAGKKEDVTPPCGRLREENVSVQSNEAVGSQGFLIDLPPFEEVAEKMVLLDRLSGLTVIEYVLRNYKHSDTQLKWDVSDLNPGFYALRICFPDGWFHDITFIKFFPFYVEPDKIPKAPEKRWQSLVDKVVEAFAAPQRDENTDLPNQALDLCLEWGEMFNQPTQERMMQRHSDLTREKADELDRLAREVRSFVYDLCQQESEGKIEESKLHMLTRRKYPWVSDTNFYRMKNVGMYYARR